MVIAYGGDDRDEWHDDIGGVQTPSKTCLHHGQVNVLLCEVFEGHGGHDLERAGVWQLFYVWLELLQYRDHLLLADEPFVDLDSFPKSVEVRLGEKPHPVASRLQDAGCHGAGGSFAFGARHVHGLQSMMGITEHREEFSHIRQVEATRDVLVW